MNKKAFCFGCALGLTAAFFHVCHVAPESPAEHILVVAPSPEQQPMDDIAEQHREQLPTAAQDRGSEITGRIVRTSMPFGFEFGAGVAAWSAAGRAPRSVSRDLITAGGAGSA
jgi:hypothetical protein